MSFSFPPSSILLIWSVFVSIVFFSSSLTLVTLLYLLTRSFMALIYSLEYSFSVIHPFSLSLLSCSIFSAYASFASFIVLLSAYSTLIAFSLSLYALCFSLSCFTMALFLSTSVAFLLSCLIYSSVAFIFSSMAFFSLEILSSMS